MLIYIAGPYPAGDTEENIEKAKDAAMQLLNAGHTGGVDENS
jgi:hypothetical protein